MLKFFVSYVRKILNMPFLYSWLENCMLFGYLCN